MPPRPTVRSIACHLPGGNVCRLMRVASGNMACSRRPTMTSTKGSHSLYELTGQLEVMAADGVVMDIYKQPLIHAHFIWSTRAICGSLLIPIGIPEAELQSASGDALYGRSLSGAREKLCAMVRRRFIFARTARRKSQSENC